MVSTETIGLNEITALEKQVDTLEEILLRIASNAVIGDLTATVAHEINNPIFGILNFLELAIEELDPLHPVQEYLRESLEQAERISSLIEQLMCVVRTESSVKESFDPLDAVQSAVTLYKKRLMREGINIKFHGEESLPTIYGVKGSFISIIIDLLDNARRSLELGNNGLVIVEAGVADSGNVRISIEDNGIGLPDCNIDILFRPYVSFWEPAGAGLGLQRVKTISESMGGRVNLKTVKDQSGVRVQLELPCIRMTAV